MSHSSNLKGGTLGATRALGHVLAEALEESNYHEAPAVSSGPNQIKETHKPRVTGAYIAISDDEGGTETGGAASAQEEYSEDEDFEVQAREKKHALIATSSILGENSKKLMMALSPTKLALGSKGNPKKKVKLKTKEQRLRHLIAQTHKIIRDIETEKRELLKVQHQVMDADLRLEELTGIFGGYRYKGSTINSGEPPNADKYEDEGFLFRAIRALESRLHTLRTHLGNSKSTAESLKKDINEKRFAKQNTKVLAMSWVATVQERQDRLSEAKRKERFVKHEIKLLQRDVEEMKATDHKEALENNALLRQLAAERTKQRTQHNKILVAPKQVAASVRRQKNLEAMGGNSKTERDDNDDTESELGPTDEELAAFIKEQEEKKEMAEREQRNKVSMRMQTGSIEKINKQPRPLTGLPRRPTSQASRRPSTSGPGLRKKREKWHPGGNNSAVSRLDGKMVPAGRRGSLVGRAPGRTVHGKMSGKVELLLAKVPNADAMKKKNERKAMVTKWKLARVGAEAQVDVEYGFEELSAAFGRLKDGNPNLTIDGFVKNFLDMEHQQLSFIRRMEYCESQLQGLLEEREMLNNEKNAYEGKVGEFKRQTQAGKAARMEELHKRESIAIEQSRRFEEEYARYKKMLNPTFAALTGLMNGMDAPMARELLPRTERRSLFDDEINESNVERVLGEIECNIEEMTAIVTRWEKTEEFKEMEKQRRMTNGLQSSFGNRKGRKELVGTVTDQMHEKERKQGALYNAVALRDSIKSSLEGDHGEPNEPLMLATASKSIRPQSAKTLKKVVLPKEVEIDDGESSDEDELLPLSRSALIGKAKAIWDRRQEIERFVQMQKAGSASATKHKRLQNMKEENYGSTKGMRFTRRRQIV
jgi:hypothetical protein